VQERQDRGALAGAARWRVRSELVGCDIAMRDRELYAQILGIQSPWEVTDVKLDMARAEVRVYLVNRSRKRMPCPECEEPSPGYDTQERQWRHLDTCQMQTLLIAHVPRVECRQHGVRQVKVPWAEERSRFTALFEAVVIDWLQEASIKAVAERLGLSWDEADGIMQRAVRRGLERRAPELPAQLSVDEKAFRRGHDYVTVISDPATKTVLHVADGRTRESLDVYYKQFSEAERAGVESVAMDMWEPFIQSTRTHVENADAKICFDKFHIAKHLGEAVNQVRIQEHKTLMREGDTRLKGTKYLWLKHPDNFSDERWSDFATLRHSTMKTARAWALKEAAMQLWDYTRRVWAEQAWRRWYGWAIRSRLEPMKRVARMVKRHWDGIITAVIRKVTSASAEGLNSVIQWLQSSARGFRNRERFKNAIYFHLGGLELYPAGVSRSL
jgi:transposase